MIRITKQTDYAVVLLTRMSQQPERLYSAADLATDTRLPAPMVSKILKTLARERLLDSHRGVKGGYALSRSPEDVTVAEIVSAIEGPIGITECIDDTPGECGYASLCGLRSNWNQINSAIRDALDGITLAEMAPPAPARLVTLGERAPVEARQP